MTAPVATPAPVFSEQAFIPVIYISDPIALSIRVDLGYLILKNGIQIATCMNSQVFVKGDIKDLMTFLGKTTGAEVSYAKTIWSIS